MIRYVISCVKVRESAIKVLGPAPISRDGCWFVHSSSCRMFLQDPVRILQLVWMKRAFQFATWFNDDTYKVDFIARKVSKSWGSRSRVHDLFPLLCRLGIWETKTQDPFTLLLQFLGILNSEIARLLVQRSSFKTSKPLRGFGTMLLGIGEMRSRCRRRSKVLGGSCEQWRRTTSGCLNVQGSILGRL